MAEWLTGNGAGRLVRALAAAACVALVLPAPKAAAAAACADIDASVLRDAAQVAIEAEAPVRSGAPFRLTWSVPAPACDGPAFLVVALPPRVRLSGDGFMALAPGEPAPFGIEHAIDRLRLFVPLHLAEARHGTALVTPFLTGRIEAQWALAVPGRTAVPAGLIDRPVAPGEPKIVVQDSFAADVPIESRASGDGDYRLAVFDGHFRVTDALTGAQVIAAEGYRPTFSPTGRFLHWFGDMASQLRVFDLVAESLVLELDPQGVGGRGTFVQGVQWSPGDSFMLAAYEAAGAIGFLETLTGRGYRYHAEGCGACDPTEEAVVEVEAENTLVRLGSHDPEVAYSLVFDRKLIDDVNGDEPFAAADAAAHVVSPRPTLGSAGRGLSTWRLNGDPRASLSPLDGVPLLLDETGDGSPETSGAGTLAAAADGTVLRAAARLRPIERFNRASRIADRLAALGIGYRGQAALALDRVTFESMKDDADDEAEYRVASGSAARARRLADAALAARFDAAAATLTMDSEDSEVYAACTTVGRSSEARVWSLTYQDRLRQIVQFHCFVSTGAFPEGAAYLLEESAGGVAVTLIGQTLDGDMLAFDPRHADDPDVRADTEDAGDAPDELLDMTFYDELRVFRPDERHAALLNSRGELALLDLADRSVPFRHARLEGFANVAEIALSEDGRHLVQVNADGRFFVHAIGSGETVLAGRFVDDEVVAYGAGYRFEATPEGARHVHLKFPGDRNLYELAQFGGTLATPGLVAQTLKGDARPSAAAAPGVPPRLTLRTRAGDTPGQVILEASATGEAGLARLAIFRDGRPVEVVALSGREAAVERAVAVAPETRAISARVFDERGLASLTVDAPAPVIAQLRPRGRLFVLAVGTDRYDDPAIGDLRYAVQDARRFAAAAAAGSPYYAGVETEVIADAAGLAAVLPSRLDAIAARMGADDTLFLHVAGHGLVDEAGAFRLADRGTRLDGLARTAVGMDEVSAALRRLPGRAFLFLDACHSGAAGTASNDVAVEELLAEGSAAVAVLSASKGRQFSLEGPGFDGGAFTAALAAIFSDRAAADSNGDGALDFDELYGALKRRVVTQTGGRQTPWVARSGLTGITPLM
ncbi:caspase family protein [Aquibium sp. ELW1220]|uniref:caspase family protein n=1 Tax=Aquibium sp. ELW1220 TaxID=2976766 RepID=UPI0025B02DF1|nr:caspase family protein [Aquibium sp. ELW1220]MDN2583682.1 caspase family protein [Aquibium sp. ELW1220]